MEEVKVTQSRKKIKDQLPSKIGGYKPIQALNSGAMGSLWLCRDPSLDRLVVAKRLHSNLNQQDIYIKRFLQEGSILAHLNHPSITSRMLSGKTAMAITRCRWNTYKVQASRICF